MLDHLSLRQRIFLFFALLALGSLAIIAAAMIFAAQRIGPDATPHLVLFGGMAGFAIAGLCLWVWMQFDENVAKPIDHLARTLNAVTHGSAVGDIDEKTGRYLGFLAPAAQDIASALASARSNVDRAIKDVTAEVEQQKPASRNGSQ